MASIPPSACAVKHQHSILPPQSCQAGRSSRLNVHVHAGCSFQICESLRHGHGCDWGVCPGCSWLSAWQRPRTRLPAFRPSSRPSCRGGWLRPLHRRLSAFSAALPPTSSNCLSSRTSEPAACTSLPTSASAWLTCKPLSAAYLRRGDPLAQLLHLAGTQSPAALPHAQLCWHA